MTHDAREMAWSEAQHALSHILYEHDPEGMGSTVGAPEDEYDDGAIALLRRLGQLESQSMPSLVYEFWPTASDELVDALAEAWNRYEARLQAVADDPR